MKQISKYTLQFIREHKNSKTGWAIWKLMPISKTFTGVPELPYVIWWGKEMLDRCATYKDAVRRRREIYNLA